MSDESPASGSRGSAPASRRGFLATAASVAVAGCGGLAGTTGTPTRSPTPTPGPVAVEFFEPAPPLLGNVTVVPYEADDRPVTASGSVPVERRRSASVDLTVEGREGADCRFLGHSWGLWPPRTASG